MKGIGKAIFSTNRGQVEHPTASFVGGLFLLPGRLFHTLGRHIRDTYSRFLSVGYSEVNSLRAYGEPFRNSDIRCSSAPPLNMGLEAKRLRILPFEGCSLIGTFVILHSIED